MAQARNGPTLRSALEETMSLLRASAFEIGTLVIEGDRASAIVHATFVFTPTGETVTTELCHMWTFRDGRAVELIEFVDTAHLADLHGRIPTT